MGARAVHPQKGVTMSFPINISVWPLAAMVTFFPLKAYAGAFCLAGPALAPQCFYDDVQTCSKAAEPPSTSCVINPESYFAYTGSSKYCVVYSPGVAECFYIDRSQCNSTAEKAKGLCVDREDISQSSDPFKYDPRLQR